MSSRESLLRIGVIGAGNMAHAHMRSYRADGRAQVVGVVDVNAAQAQRAADEFGARAFTGVAQMLEAERPAAVSICTPPVAHREAALECLARGMHVLCEKPLGYSAAEAREMVEAAARQRVLLMTAFCHRFHEPVVKAKALIERGRLGRILMYRNRFGGSIRNEERWFGRRAQAGGGALLDNSVHSADLFRFLVGEVAAVSAAADTLVQRIDVEDSGAMLLRSTGGAIAVIETSWSTPHCVNDIEIYGERGAAIVDYDGSHLRYQVAGMTRWRTVRPTGPDRFTLEVRHFVDCVRGESELKVTGADGLQAQLIIEAAYRSAAEKTWVQL